ncbi:MAG: c-type cytochrome [Campylobacterota bacterium]
MRLLKPLTITLFTATTLMANTTMCFKENHPSMGTIEKTKLNGGACKGQYSLKQMKEKGYSVDDIKVTTNKSGNYNFVYILKDKSSNQSSNFAMTNSNLSEKQLEQRILKRLETKKSQEKKAKQIEQNLQAQIEGKKIYTNKCQNCHGEKGETRAYNASKPLQNLSLDDMQFAINRYTTDDDYGNGYQMLMKPIASGMTNNKIAKIHQYLKSINKN